MYFAATTNKRHTQGLPIVMSLAMRSKGDVWLVGARVPFLIWSGEPESYCCSGKQEKHRALCGTKTDLSQVKGGHWHKQSTNFYKEISSSLRAIFVTRFSLKFGKILLWGHVIFARARVLKT